MTHPMTADDARGQSAEGMDFCPDCQGRGFVYAFVDREDGGGFDPALKCLRCQGAGQIPQRMVGWIKRGRACMDLRRHRAESLMDVARRLGMKPVEVSAMEHGRANPLPLERAWANA